MPIAAGVILNPLVSTIMAMLRCATESGGAAMDDCSQHSMLVGGMMAAVLTEELTGSIAKDIGHFEVRLHQNNSGMESSECFGLGGGSIASPSSSIRLGASACWPTEIWV
jgi:hypothetical protein